MIGGKFGSESEQKTNIFQKGPVKKANLPEITSIFKWKTGYEAENIFRDFYFLKEQASKGPQPI